MTRTPLSLNPNVGSGALPRGRAPWLSGWCVTIAPMVDEDFEAALRDRKTARVASAWTSVWWDLRTAYQIVYDRSNIQWSSYEQVFTRRSMIDGAIITYGRCFLSGSRYEAAEVEPLVNQMGDDALAVHNEAMRWRNRHVAHRVDTDWEQSDVRILWRAFGTAPPTFRIRLVTALGPDDEFAVKLGEHAKTLADRVWEKRLIPLKDRYFADVDPVKLQNVRDHHAATYEPPQQREGVIGVTLDIGDTQ